jgi:hypothetical protein
MGWEKIVVGFVVACLVLMMTGVVAMTPVEARLAPPGNQYDRQAVVNEAWYAMSGDPYTCPTKQYNGYTVSVWNYMANDISAQKELVRRFGSCAGWSAKKVADGYYNNLGRGGQCLFFVNLILYRSEADQSYHNRWVKLESSYSDIIYMEYGDIIFTRNKWSKAGYNHTAIVVYRSGDTVGLIESNYVEPNPKAEFGKGEIISYRTTTLSKLRNRGYKVYTGVDYYWTSKADLNCDNKVNLADYAILMSYWDTNGFGATSCRSPDINHNGKVDIVDFSIMMSQWDE